MPLPVRLHIPLTYFLYMLSWIHGYTIIDEDMPADVALSTLTSDFWLWKTREFPELATIEGVHDYDDVLESYSYSNFAARLTYCQHLLSQLQTINATALSHTGHQTYDVLTDQLTTFIDGYRWREYGALNPINFLEGIHRSYGWIGYCKFLTVSDYTKYLRRLDNIPKQIEQVINLLEMAIGRRRTNHAVSMRGVIAEIANLSEVHAFSTPFYWPYGDTLDDNIRPHTLRLQIRSEGKNMIENSVQKSLRRLKIYLETRYIPSSRPQVGVHSLENGKEYYRSLLRWHLSTDITPEKIHETGLKEVARIRIEMEKLMRYLFHDGDLLSFLAHLREKSEFYDHDERGLLEKYKNVVYRRIQPRLPQLFSNLDSIPNITIKAMSRDGIDASYVKETMLINTYMPHTRPDFSALTLCLHEAEPGHHLQVSFARNQPLPEFRRYVWANKKFSAPFHFPYYTAYVEGWALYAEFLGEELALFDEPYELFGRYTFEIFRAGRLVVDTGIHAMGWGRDEAIEYLRNHTFMTHAQVEKEVDRYITWPGQACAYKIGELKIKELRTRAMDTLGWKYSPQDFHQRVLEIGPVPLHLLERHIDRWIAKNVPSVAHSKQMDDFNFCVVLVVMFFRACMMHFNIM